MSRSLSYSCAAPSDLLANAHTHTLSVFLHLTQTRELLFKGWKRNAGAKATLPAALSTLAALLSAVWRWEIKIIKATTKLEKYLVDAVSGRAYKMCESVCGLTERQLGEAAWLSLLPGSVNTHAYTRTYICICASVNVCTIVYTLAAADNTNKPILLDFILFYFFICFCFFYIFFVLTCCCAVVVVVASSCCFCFCCFCRWFASAFGVVCALKAY